MISYPLDDDYPVSSLLAAHNLKCEIYRPPVVPSNFATIMSNMLNEYFLDITPDMFHGVCLVLVIKDNQGQCISYALLRGKVSLSHLPYFIVSATGGDLDFVYQREYGMIAVLQSALTQAVQADPYFRFVVGANSSKYRIAWAIHVDEFALYPQVFQHLDYHQASADDLAAIFPGPDTVIQVLHALHPDLEASDDMSSDDDIPAPPPNPPPADVIDLEIEYPEPLTPSDEDNWPPPLALAMMTTSCMLKMARKA